MMIRLCRLAPAVVRWRIRHTSPKRFSRQFGLQLTPVDRARYVEAEVLVADAYAEAARNGPYGLAEDWRLMATPSGLNYASVECPVHLWHGDSDGLVPLHHAEYVTKLVPKAELEVLPRVGHFHDTELWRDVLRAAQTSTSR
jgi:pimeloyl-ACP methyl ester carboxylesterase